MPRPVPPPARAGGGRLQPGEILDGKYRITRTLGEGGMGIVYEGENIRISRRVAIKVLHAHVAGDAVSVRRFEREAQAAGRIGSEHIVEVLDLGELPGGERYMVMEYLDGRSLHSVLKHAVTAAQFVPIAIQLLHGLSEAHRAEIIHRDLKPANVYIVKARRGGTPLVKILDFGISKFRATGDDFEATSTGTIVGTPYYMAPEQAKAEKTIDHRVDLYSVGVILYRALSGQVPFTAESFTQLVLKVVLEDPTPLGDLVPGLDPELAAIAHRAMARNPNDRFQSADQFANALEQWLARRGTAEEGSGDVVGRPSVAGVETGQGSRPGFLLETGPSGTATPSGAQLGDGWRHSPASGSSLERVVGVTPPVGAGSALPNATDAASSGVTPGAAPDAILAEPTAALPSGTWPNGPSGAQLPALAGAAFHDSVAAAGAAGPASMSVMRPMARPRVGLWLAVALVAVGGLGAAAFMLGSRGPDSTDAADPDRAPVDTQTAAAPVSATAAPTGAEPPAESGPTAAPTAGSATAAAETPVAERSTAPSAKTKTPAPKPEATAAPARTSTPAAPQPSSGTANGRPFRQDL